MNLLEKLTVRTKIIRMIIKDHLFVGFSIPIDRSGGQQWVPCTIYIASKRLRATSDTARD